MAMRPEHVYMGIDANRHNKRQMTRQYGPYILTAAIVVFMLWWAQGMRLEIQRDQAQLRRPLQEVVSEHKQQDWTQHIKVRPSRYDGPDDDTVQSCPTPTGNWAHTCQREILIEGPCSRRCLLIAVCMDVHRKFQNTTFEYTEGVVVEVKNVNGLLCSMREDGSLACGVNFHGNIATKNCQGYVPRRHESRHDGLEGPKPLGGDYASAGKCGEPAPVQGVDFTGCAGTSLSEMCSPKCAMGYSGTITSFCTSSGWRHEGRCTLDSDDAPAPKKEAKKDWTHRLSLNTIRDDDAPDDPNQKNCPTPRGNWRHTCLADIVVEGPCSGKCLLKARCRNLNTTFQDTTLEFREYQKFEAKNVNGLLCRLDDDGTPSCGLNFHGNLALKNCAQGHIPHRHEQLADALSSTTAKTWQDTTEEDVKPRRKTRRSADVEADEEDTRSHYHKKYDPVVWDRDTAANEENENVPRRRYRPRTQAGREEM